MPTAPDIDDPKYWHQRAKEARRLAKRMSDEMAKQTMLRIAEECNERCRLLALANSQVRLRGWLLHP
jgi:hypothetical protein